MGFVLGDAEVAAEAKCAHRVRSDTTRNLSEFRKERPHVQELILACCEEKPRRTDEGVWILLEATFIERLWFGELPLSRG